MPENYSLQLNTPDPILNNVVSLKISPNISNDSLIAINFIVMDLSTNQQIVNSQGQTDNYSISSISVGDNETTFQIQFTGVNLSTTPISIQLKKLDSANPPNVIAISTFAYINFPSPYDSTIEISKPYLVKYINKVYKVKVTLKNNYDNTIPTEYKVIYKATKK